MGQVEGDPAGYKAICDILVNVAGKVSFKDSRFRSSIS